MQTIGHSSIDITAVAYSGPEVLFKTCVAMKFVDDDDDDDELYVWISICRQAMMTTSTVSTSIIVRTAVPAPPSTGVALPQLVPGHTTLC